VLGCYKAAVTTGWQTTWVEDADDNGPPLLCARVRPHARVLGPVPVPASAALYALMVRLIFYPGRASIYAHATVCARVGGPQYVCLWISECVCNHMIRCGIACVFVPHPYPPLPPPPSLGHEGRRSRMHSNYSTASQPRKCVAPLPTEGRNPSPSSPPFINIKGVAGMKARQHLTE